MNRSKLNVIVFLGIAISCTACGSSAKLTRAGNSIKVSKKEPVHCKELGKFMGKGTLHKYALNDLKNRVAEKGGDHLYIVNAMEFKGKGATFAIGNDHYVHGYGFKCR